MPRRKILPAGAIPRVCALVRKTLLANDGARMDAHGIPRDTLATHTQLLNQTAAGYAAKAFSEAWPCQK